MTSLPGLIFNAIFNIKKEIFPPDRPIDMYRQYQIEKQV